MKKLLILAFVLAIGSSALAQNKKSATYKGVVDKYDVATKTLTIKRGDKQGEFVITDTSEVLNGKTKADASAFAAGQKAEVEFVMDGAKKMIKKAKITK